VVTKTSGRIVVRSEGIASDARGAHKIPNDHRQASYSIGAIVLVAVLASSASAQAQLTFPAITNRNFNIDLFEQPAIGSPRLIAMSGAIDAVAEGAAGLFVNPASAAVRPETTASKLAWNVYFNTYIPADGQDSNNNGQSVTSVHRSLLGAAGILLQYEQWGLSIDGGYTSYEIAPQAGGGLGIRSLIGHVGLARTFLDQTFSAGIGLRLGGLNVYTLDTSAQTLFTRLGASPDAGGVWMPKGRDFRVALSGGLPFNTAPITYSCDPNDCDGYILPSNAIVPWDMTVGGAWRFGPTAWNDKITGDYRDERQLTVALELTLIGAVDNGYGMEAFAAKQLQVSGRNISPTPRLGLESEVIPAWLRLRAGSYLEASRFPETSARWHATGGAEIRVFSFQFSGHQRRVSISVAGDFASRYKNAALSVGFWN
jgi:hypothetical protein